MRSITALLVLLSLVFTGPALADKRVALVIGNSAYKNVPQLANPKNDASDMAAKLEALGFEVVQGEDLDLRGMRSTVRDFVRKLDGADLSLFFYAGHGLQVNGNNYMAPVDAQLASYDDLDFEALPMDLVLSAMERNTKVNLIFLDACRDNPLAQNLARSMGTRSTAVGRGLAKIGSGIGSLIAFSTQPGNVALDGDGRNSPFTTALLKHLGTPGKSVTTDLISVRKDVLAATGGKQVPWDNSSLTGPVVLVPKASVTQADQIPDMQVNRQFAPTDSSQFEITFWNSIKDSSAPPLIETYLKRYPNGTFAEIARVKIKLLNAAAERAKRETAASKAEVARITAEAKSKQEKTIEVARLEQPGDTEPAVQSIDPVELVRSTQYELARIGCLSGRIDGKWGSGSRGALKNYAVRQGVRLASLEPSVEVLDRLKATSVRVCPLVCGRGTKEKNGRCEKVKREASVKPNSERQTHPEAAGNKKTESQSNANPRECFICIIGIGRLEEKRCRRPNDPWGIGLLQGQCRKL